MILRVDTVLLRNVVERHEATHVAAMRWIVLQCLRNSARSFSPSMNGCWRP